MDHIDFQIVRYHYYSTILNSTAGFEPWKQQPTQFPDVTRYCHGRPTIKMGN
jgi:hypothetical protein